jgi:hypothetical protein
MYFTNEESYRPIPNNFVETKSYIEVDSNYKIQFNYADPFLKEIVKLESKLNFNNSQKSKKESFLNSKNKHEDDITQKIKYCGQVKNGKTGKISAVLVINGQYFVGCVNQKLENVLITKISENELTILNGNKRYTVKK